MVLCSLPSTPIHQWHIDSQAIKLSMQTLSTQNKYISSCNWVKDKVVFNYMITHIIYAPILCT